MRGAPCTPLTVLVLTAIMMGTAAAGPTLSERAPPDFAGSGRPWATSAESPPPSERHRPYYDDAVRGDPDAQAKLAALYAQGAGVPQSDAAAFQWSMRAAGQGHAQAQLMLSEFFASDKLHPKNSIAAYKWALIAAASAREPKTRNNATGMLDLLAAEMSREQMDEARRLAATWRPKRELPQLVNVRAAERRTSRVTTPRSVGAKPSARLYLRLREARAAAAQPERIATRIKALRAQLRAQMTRRICRRGAILHRPICQSS
jgi:hypothetical protein